MTTDVQPKSQDLSESAIAAIIEDRIKRGIYAPGSRVPAERNLAEEFGVSRRFVRLAYTLLIDQGLLEKSHYRRPVVPFDATAHWQQSGMHQGEVSGESGLATIAAVLPSHPVFPGGLSIVAGIHRVLTDLESNYRLTLHDTFHKDRPEVLRREARAIASILDDDVAGLIWWYYSDEAVVEKVLRERPDVPVVFIDRHPEKANCDFTGIDDVESSRLAVEYLIDLGHTRIAHLMDPGNYSTILERAAGYREAHMARGLRVDESLIVHLDWREQRMAQAFDHLFSQKNPPTALFASNDFIAHEFINEAESRGLKIPDDLSVVGHGNIDRYTPRQFLTTVDQPFEMIGKTAAKLLLKRLEDRGGLAGTFQHVILQAPLIVRKSTRALPDTA